MPRINQYTISDLKRLLNSRKWFAADPLPITKQRALSHVNNPRAELSDVALLVAYEGETVVAYLGILPDKAFVKQAEYKIGWLTAWWANPERRFAGLGTMLLMRALNLYRDGLGASGFSSDSKRVFAALKRFTPVQEIRGFTGFVGLDLVNRLPRRWPMAAQLKCPLQACDWVIHKTAGLRQALWRRQRTMPKGFRIEYFAEFDQEAEEYIGRHQGNELTRRGARELNWILRYPWALPAPLAEPTPYYFSSAVKSYCNYNLKVYDTNDCLIAVLMLIVIDGHLIAPYCYHDDQALLCAQIIGHHVGLLRLKALATYRSDLLEAFSDLKFPWAWRVPRTRTWVMAGACASGGLEGYSMQDGDGDLAWTL